jgi:spore maturation protein CgeB
MKFMFVNYWDIHVKYGWKPALLSAGHTVVEYGGYEALDSEYASFKLWQDIHKEMPDCVIFIGTGTGITAFNAMIEACHKLGILLIFHAVEDPVDYINTLRIANGADIIYSLDDVCVEKYKTMGKSSSLFLPAVNIETHYPGSYRKDLAYDVSMVATCYPQHEARRKGYETIVGAAVSLYEKKEISFRIYGNWWWMPIGMGYINSHEELIGGLLPFELVPSLYSSSKITLGIQCLDNSKTQSSQRPFEALACGSFHITQWTPSMDYIFKEGINIVTSKTKEETKEKIIYYLNHNEEREKIAKNGQELIYNKHTYTNRLNEIVIPDLKKFGITDKWRGKKIIKTEERTNIIFLDFDGVLNNRKYDDPIDQPIFNKNSLKNLKEIIDKFNCKIVITSNWRGVPNSLKYGLSQIKEYIPDLEKRYLGITSMDYMPSRGHHIKQWLNRNPLYKYCNFVIIDDLNDMDDLIEGLAQCGECKGLDEEAKNKAIKILQEGLN